MKHIEHAFLQRCRLAGIAILVALASSAASADATVKATTPPATSGAATLGGALPGGAIISARFVQLTPAAGGDAVTTAIASDGSFHFDKLKPGSYRLVVASRQTQGTTFGEKVNAGLAQTGNAVASGASRSQKDAAAVPADNARLQDNMPARISVNVTVGRQNGRVAVDGPGADVQVGTDGSLSGTVHAAAD